MSTASLSSADVLQRIQTVIEARLPKNGGDPQQSYVAKLCTKGEDAILKKIGEEATEVVIAGKSHDNKAIIYEVADLWFHSMVLLAYHDIDTQSVLTELARREGLSGLAEFAARTATTTQGE